MLPSLRYVRILFNPGGEAELVFTRTGGRMWSGPSSAMRFEKGNLELGKKARDGKLTIEDMQVALSPCSFPVFSL